MIEIFHRPVMLPEVLDGLDCQEGKIFVDCTLGGAGHAAEIVKKIGSKGSLIGIDCDREAIAEGKGRLKNLENVKIFHDNFIHLKKILTGCQITMVDGIFFDLGVSTHQLKTKKRGFSFQIDGPLDMRMDQGNLKTAAHLINELNREELGQIIKNFGEQKWPRKIAKAIVQTRREKAIVTTFQLVNIIKRTLSFLPPKAKNDSIRKTFMAFRLATNNELSNLQQGLEEAIDLLKFGGRLAVISFHSLEDRIVKKIFREKSKQCICPPTFPRCVCKVQRMLEIITPKPIVPGDEEIMFNARARGAKLRIAGRI